MKHTTLSVFDYKNNKVCELYDSNSLAVGRPHDIELTKDRNGDKTLKFNMPYLIPGEGDNFRWKYIINEYLLRVTEDDEVDWFIINDPKKTKANGINELVTCSHTASILKTKNIYVSYDDETGIGNINYLLNRAINGTGWRLGNVDIFYENDGTTEKVRSLSSDGKKGAYQLIIDICNLFKAYPIFHGDGKTIDVHSINNREREWELIVGRNMSALSTEYDSKDIVTRLYVEGEYGDFGYVGIDSANPTGLSFILNFDYYKKVGLFDASHQAAQNTYLHDIKIVKRDITEQTGYINAYEDTLSTNWGVIKYVVYKLAAGSITLTMKGNGATDDDAIIDDGDELVIIQGDGIYRTVLVETTPTFLTTDTYAIKFVEKANGLIGAREATVIAKNKLISGWIDAIAEERKKTEPDEVKIADWEHNIEVLEEEIDQQYDGTSESVGLYRLMRESAQAVYDKHVAEGIRDALLDDQLQIETDFIVAMGDMLKDGYWSNTNYIPGQEQFLYNDAIDVSEVMGKPSVKYTLSIVPVAEAMGVTIDDVEINSLCHIMDDELEVKTVDT